MSYALLRRAPLAALDRRVARASMQICHKVLMRQLYISRADVRKQWLVVSNPSEDPIDLTGYTIASVDGRQIFHFPRNYMLLAGDEVTVWCSPSTIDLDVDNLLQPYLFWTTRPGGALRSAPFFTHGVVNEVLLLDPFKVEVASLRVAEDGKKEFRVLHCVSVHPRTVASSIDTRFCVGCLSPPEFQRRAFSPSPDSGKVPRSSPPRGRDVYVFSRYWGVVSDKSLLEHFVSVLLVPLLESFRALLVYVLLATFHHEQSHAVGTHVRLKVVAIALLMVACDLMARRLSLCIKSGLLVSIASFTAVVLDQLATIATYTSLQRVHPDRQQTFVAMLRFELAVSLTNMAAIHCHFLEERAQWHRLFHHLSVLEHRFQTVISLCGLGRQLLLLLLLLQPFSSPLSSQWQIVGYVLAPLFVVAAGFDALRALATVLHLVRYPFMAANRAWPPRPPGAKPLKSLEIPRRPSRLSSVSSSS